MNICLVSREYPSENHQGGIGTYTEKTAWALAALGQQVYVITEARQATPVTREHGVRIIRLAAPQARLREARLAARAHAVASVIARLPQVPDIVQVCEWEAEGFWYALGRHPRTRLVTRLATPTFLVDQLDSDARARDWCNPLATARAGIVDRLERFQTKRSDAIISPTDALAGVVCARWGIPQARITRMPTGVNFARRFAADPPALPSYLRGQDYLLYFGRLEVRKGAHILARALPRVLAAFPRLRMVFAGADRPYKGQSMRSYIATCCEPYCDRLYFLPRLPQRELYPLLKHALMAVLPSLWENMANTCLEALDMGVPVIATRGCGYDEVLDDGRAGLLVPPGDTPALSQAIFSLLVQRGRLSGMAHAARVNAERFALSATTERLLRFYETLHAGPLSAP